MQQQPQPRTVLLGALTAIVAFAIDIYLPALPQVAEDLGTTTATTQLTLAALLLGLAVGQVLGGSWSDARGRRLPILVGCFGYSVAALLCAVAPSIDLLIAMRFLQGVLGALCIVAGRAVVRDCWEGAEAARMFSRLQLILGVAPVFAPLAGAGILQVTSWRGIFVVLAGIGAVLGVAAWRALPETLPVARRRTGGLRETVATYGLLLRDRQYVLIVLAAGIGYGSLFVYLSGSSFTLQDRFGLSPTEYAFAFGACGVGFVVSAQTGSALVRRTGARRLVLAGAALQVLAGLVLALGQVAGLGAVLAGFFLVTVSVGLIPSNATALALADHAAQAGAAAALLGLVSQLSSGILSPLIGVAGTPAPLLLGSVVLTCGLGCFLLTVASHLEARRSEPADLPA